MTSERKPRILVVDDTPENLDVIRGILADRYRLTTTRDGGSALELAGRLSPDLILLDIMMPGMDGYEVLRRLRHDDPRGETPVIFLTALSGEGYETKGLSLGVVDYITKPIVPDVLRARVATQLALRTARLELQQRNDQLQREREIIEEIVLRLRDEPAFDPANLEVMSLSPETASGDLVLAATAPDGVQHVLLGDFTGHGLPAAVGAPLISHIFYDQTSCGTPLEEILENLNRVLLERYPAHIFMATAAAAIDRDRRRLRCFNCGQPDILVCDGSSLRPIPSSRPPIGILPFGDSPGFSDPIDFSSGDRLYLRTDGFHEAPSPTGEAFGEERFRALLARTAAGLAPLGAITDQVLAHAGSLHRLDDMTLVEITL